MKIGIKPMITNKYGSNATVAQFEYAAKVRKFKYEQQVKASKAGAYGMLIFAACLIGAIVYNIISGLAG